MAKGPKPPKGGARNSHNRPSPGSQPRQIKITADEMYRSNNMYKDMMWKPGQVKTPEDMVVNEKSLEQLELLKALRFLMITKSYQEMQGMKKLDNYLILKL